jgi:hypothetical protein
MNKWLRLTVVSLVMGALLAGLTFFVDHTGHVDIACTTAPGQTWTPDGVGTFFDQNRHGWPFTYYEKIPAGTNRCYSPVNIDSRYPYNGNDGQFTGYGQFKKGELIEDVAFWSAISLGLNSYLNYVFMPRRAMRYKK